VVHGVDLPHHFIIYLFAQAYNRVRDGDFSLDGLVGFDLHGKTVGVIGTGKIGQCFIDIAMGYGCKIAAFDVYPNAQYGAMEQVCD
jgi:D-lactate dehydrogenase